MDRAQSGNVIPLVEVAIAHRDRLVNRARVSDVPDFVALQNAIIQIDRWLIGFAYPRMVPDCWRSRDVAASPPDKKPRW